MLLQPHFVHYIKIFVMVMIAKYMSLQNMTPVTVIKVVYCILPTSTWEQDTKPL